MKNFKKILAFISAATMIACTGLTFSRADAQYISFDNGNDLFTSELSLDYSLNLKGEDGKTEVLSPE